MDWHLDLRRPDASSPTVRVHLQGGRRTTHDLLVGLAAELRHGVGSARPDVVLQATRLGAVISLAPHVSTTVIRCAGTCRSLVTAWTLPILGVGGLTAFDPRDLRLLLRSESAVFYNLPFARGVLPGAAQDAAARARAAYAVFFGDLASQVEVDEAVEGIDQYLPPRASRIFATAVVPALPARCLLTLFG